jgi:hypothetical protein
MNYSGVSIEIFQTYAGLRGRFPVLVIGGVDPSVDSVERAIAKSVIALRQLPAGQHVAEWDNEGERYVYVFTVEREDVTITQCRVKVD